MKAKPSQAKPSQAKPSQAKPSQAKPSQAKLDEAILDYSKAIHLHPNSRTAAALYGNRGIAYVAQGERIQALVDLRKSLDLGPRAATRPSIEQFIRIIEEGGDIKIDMETSEGYSWSHTRKAASVDRNVDKVAAVDYEQKGAESEVRGDLIQALYLYTRSLEHDPNFAEAYNNRGRIYGLLRKFAEAIIDYTRAIQVNPNLASSYVGRGSAFADTGDLEESIADFTKAIALEPDNAVAHAGRGMCFQLQGKPSEAIKDLRRHLELDPQSHIREKVTALLNELEGQVD